MEETDAGPSQLNFIHVGTPGLQPPSPFNFTSPGEWTTWITRYEDYAFAAGINTATDEVQVRTLLYCMGSQARSVLSSLGLSAPENRPFAEVKAKLTSHFVHPINEIYESRRFHRRVQQLGEPVDEFFTALRNLVKRCGYNNAEIEDRLVRDKFVVGLRNEKLSDQLCRCTKLTAEEALCQARVHEEAEKERLSRETPSENGAFDSLNVDAAQRAKNASSRRSKSVQPTQSTCDYCGRGHHSRKECPARKATCNFCKKQGHFIAVCRAKHRKELLGSVELHALSTRRARYADIHVNGHLAHFKIDSGAEITVVSPSFPALPTVLDKVDAEVSGPGNQRLHVLGSFTATLQWRNKVSVQRLYVIKNQTTHLLGLPAIEDLGIVQFLDSVDGIPSSQSKIFRGLGEVQEEYHIRVAQDARPFSLSVPRRIPLPLLEHVKKELDEMETQGVIRKVDTPTAWCSGLVVVPKSSGGYRLCVDLTKLNKVIQRERYILPTVEDILGQLGGAQIFSKLDARSSFHQIKLTRESEELTTFITPFGRYCYKRLPFGIATAPEYFQRFMSRLLEGITGVVNMIDDILVFGRNHQEHDQRLADVLARLTQAGVTLNEKKCQFRVSSVKFLGVVVSQQGISPDPDKVKAIMDLPPPIDVSGVRRLLGMVNHVARFIPKLSEISAPIRALLNKNNAWSWSYNQEEAFKKIKSLLSSDTCMAMYNPHYPTIVSADASSHGLGAVLLQDQPSGIRRAVAYASRSLTTTEGRYSQTEKESLAVTWAVTRFDQYLRGLSFEVESDHLPLVALLSSKDLDILPPRIQRMRIKLMRYQFAVKYVPGKLLATADTLSRAPCDLPTSKAVSSLEVYIGEVLKELPLQLENQLDEIRRLQAQDSECSSIMTYCEKGWPSKKRVPTHLAPYWKERETLSVYDGLLLLDRRIVIPSAQRKDILALLHEGHQGVRRCQVRARECVWWPHCSQHIEDLVAQCAKCAETRTLRSEPLSPTPTPERPWQRLGIDLFHLEGRDYVLIVDYYSRFPEIVTLGTSSAKAVVAAVKSCFARFGIPDVVRTDNGPQFSSKEFADFATAYRFCHETSSPRYPQSNGEVERMVRTVKDLLKKSPDPYLALLAYRDTPGVSGVSPAQLLMGRRLQTRLPVLPERLLPALPNHEEFQAQDTAAKLKQAKDYNSRHSTTPLISLSMGEDVWIKDLGCSGRVLSPAQRPRSYVVETQSGVVQRNRCHLVPFVDDQNVQQQASMASSPTHGTLSSNSPRDSASTSASESLSPSASSASCVSPVPPVKMPPSPEVQTLPVQASAPQCDEPKRTRSGRAVKPPRRLNM
nr:uncharacterized protein K02A2.6-like [Rhipicephalus microplus]